MDNSWDGLVSVYLEWPSFDHLSSYLYKKLEESISWIFFVAEFHSAKNLYFSSMLQFFFPKTQWVNYAG